MFRYIFSRYFKGDPVIWAVLVGLSLFSVLAVYSSTESLAYKYQGGNTLYYLFKHSSFLFVGILISFLVHFLSYKVFSRLSQLFMYLAVPMLLMTLLMGASLNQASRWLTLPGIGITFQTSDFAKFALIIFLARLLSRKQEVIKDFKQTFKPMIISVGLVCLLILPANFSTAAIVFITSLVLMYIGRVNLRYIFYTLGIISFLGGLLVLLALNNGLPNVGRFQTWGARIESFVEGGEEESFQAEQSKIAIVTGGFLGKGPGNSTQRNFLPHPYSDFIYAIIIEEYGTIGGVIIILLYLILLFRAGMIVRKSTSQFAAFVTIGLTISLVFQAMANMGVAVGIFPVTGQTLPYVSMGGTSILFTSTAFGIILSVSRNVRKEEFEEYRDEPMQRPSVQTI